jgi:hypothetical protein
MKHLYVFALTSLALAFSAQAQLVHLTIEGIVTDRFGGTGWWNGGGSGVGQTALLDIYYNAARPPVSSDPALPFATYLPGGADDRWRLRYGAVDIGASWRRLTVSDEDLRLFYSDLTTFTTLEADLVFANDPSPGLALPFPPLPSLEPGSTTTGPRFPSTFRFDTLDGFGLSEGTLLVGITRVTAESVNSPTPIPEAATYGWIAAAACAGAALMRRRRRT